MTAVLVPTAPARKPVRKPARVPQQPRLRVVDEVQRRRGVRFRRTAVIFGLFTICALLLTVAFYVELAQSQFQVDGISKKTQLEQKRYENLSLKVAELSAPQRIISSAQKLGMVTPQQVTYLTASTSQVSPKEALPSDMGSWEQVKPYLAIQR